MALDMIEDVLALVLALLASERIEIHGGALPAPGSQQCIRLHADGAFRGARVIVNDVNAGDLADEHDELDITGYLSPGAANTIEVRAAVDRVWAWVSPLVYIARAQSIDGGRVEVTIANTTENTAQVEIGDQQFTVSPGTRAIKDIKPPGEGRVRMRAVSDGLDREFIDEADVSARPQSAAHSIPL